MINIDNVKFCMHNTKHDTKFVFSKVLGFLLVGLVWRLAFFSFCWECKCNLKAMGKESRKKILQVVDGLVKG